MVFNLLNGTSGSWYKLSYNLFHDLLAKRADYLAVTECENFPSCFCATRWMEDQKVAERLCSIWENIKKMTKYWEALPKSKRPKCKSYNTVVEGTQDELTLAKLEFFGYIASLLQNILVKYQTDALMIPFLFEDLLSIAKSLMDVIIKAILSIGVNFKTLISLRKRLSTVKIDNNWIFCRT